MLEPDWQRHKDKLLFALARIIHGHAQARFA